MITVLIDNGSLEPAAYRNLRAVAAGLAERTGSPVHAVSWKHSDKVDPEEIGGTPAWTLGNFVRSLHSLGQREFVFIPFFISPQGAIGSALRRDLERLQVELPGLEFTFTRGLAANGAIARIAVERIRVVIQQRRLTKPYVVAVDHGGPAYPSAALRDELARDIRRRLGDEVETVAGASMEGIHPPLLETQLRAFAHRDVVVAPLFLSPGRHAGAGGDVARICAESSARCHLAELIGTHPLAVEALAEALRDTLSQLHASSSA